MGIDGFSLANLGLNINKTSSSMASEADILALMGLEHQIKDVDGITKKQKSGRKDKDAAFRGGVFTGDGSELPDAVKPKNEDSEEAAKPVLTEEDLTNFHFRLNREHMIEIYDSRTEEIIRVISPEDAAQVLLNISDVPGFIVNEKA